MFERDIENTDYLWSFSGVSPSQVIFHDGGGVRGDISFSGMERKQMTISFVMSDNIVEVSFRVNTTGRNPEETNLENNEDTITIAPAIVTEGDFEIDYNILERKVKFGLGASTARLTLPLGSWSGNAIGALNVFNNTPNIYLDFSVENNPPVNEAATIITRSPVIHTLLRRVDFGDDPRIPMYGASNSKTGQVSASGQVERAYRYSTGSGRNRRWHTGRATGYFDSLIDRKNITARVYNGMATEILDASASSASPLREEIVDGNSANWINNSRSGAGRLGAFRKNLFWVSMDSVANHNAPIKFDVVRLMYNQEEDGSLSPGSETVVAGRHERWFKWQNTAVSSARANAGASFEARYRSDFEEAMRRNYTDKGELAVFASDRNYRAGNYPIRSGYYFDPAGQYGFTIETTVYKKNTGYTREHRELVDAMIGAFRYESNMVYIDNGRTARYINGAAAVKTGASFGAAARAISVNSPGTFVNSGFFRVDRDTVILEEAEVYHSGYPSSPLSGGYNTAAIVGAAHESFRRNMEGYPESGAEASRYNYKYVEYVEENEAVYKIVERTTVTITVNYHRDRVYTHAQMSNGDDFYISVYLDLINLRDTSYRQLNNINPVVEDSLLIDYIPIDVIGSIYDDFRE
jgi:hypothetical protein